MHSHVTISPSVAFVFDGPTVIDTGVPKPNERVNSITNSALAHQSIVVHEAKLGSESLSSCMIYNCGYTGALRTEAHAANVAAHKWE